MLKREYVHSFCELKNKTIDEVVMDCYKDFTSKCYTVVKKMLAKEIEPYIGLDNYDNFNSLGRMITYKEKSVEYRELFTDLRKYMATILDNYQMHDDEKHARSEILDFLCEEVENPIGKEERIEGLTICKPKFKRFEGFFGLGEFPYMIVSIVRIGNQKYYFYQITR